MQRRGSPRRPAAALVEVTFLPGLDEVVTREIETVLGADARPVPGRTDAVRFRYAGRLPRLRELRTAVAAFTVLPFPVPRPKSLRSGEYLPTIAAAVTAVGARTFRFEAAGSDSTVFRLLADDLAAATGLRHDPREGEVVLRFLRSESGAGGWDVLVRATPRPLSDRAWRVRDMPGAVNATVAAAIAGLTGALPDDRIANPMCGSGTLLIERLLAGRARSAHGFDVDPAALDACAENVAAAGVRATLHRSDVTTGGWADAGPFDVIVADPPWGGLVGAHATNEALHLALLETAHRAAAPDARFAVLTHEIRIMDRCLRRVADRWRTQSVTRVFQKGHHPRIYLLRPAARA